mmetsp:Transcript_40789/g.87998  ORF Transcript_40789/g.87998 Transcript_40789/m.87998 type:complete len:87 (+) Transcript_40789:725-985(+)
MSTASCQPPPPPLPLLPMATPRSRKSYEEKRRCQDHAIELPTGARRPPPGNPEEFLAPALFAPAYLRAAMGWWASTYIVLVETLEI